MARQRSKKCDFDWYTPSLNNRRIGNAKTLKSAAASSLQSNKSGKLRWLDTVFQGQYLPSLSINYVAINRVLEKLPPQLY